MIVSDNSVPREEKGFTLVELMVVLVILGLLITIVAIKVLPTLDTAKVGKAKADVATLETAVELFRLQTQNYPTSSDGLQALVSPPASLTRPELYQRGGYVKRLPNDPWGRAYVYAQPGTHGPFDIYSLGADGVPGGEADDADVGNW
jgi:general secretion pathway protein G